MYLNIFGPQFLSGRLLSCKTWFDICSVTVLLGVSVLGGSRVGITTRSSSSWSPSIADVGISAIALANAGPVVGVS